VATNSGDPNGRIISINSRRYEPQPTGYLDADTIYTMDQPNANKNPQGIEFLPQRVQADPDNPWRAIIVNMGFGLDPDEDSQLIRMPGLLFNDTIDTNVAGQHPLCYKGVDAAISPTGNRAFISFNESSNIGLVENLLLPGLNQEILPIRFFCFITMSAERNLHGNMYLFQILIGPWILLHRNCMPLIFHPTLYWQEIPSG